MVQESGIIYRKIVNLFVLNLVCIFLSSLKTVECLWQHLLSSSVDKSVRLWRVGHDGCLKVFFHSNYGSCLAVLLILPHVSSFSIIY